VFFGLSICVTLSTDIVGMKPSTACADALRCG
jgi:hypothetical protein